MTTDSKIAEALRTSPAQSHPWIEGNRNNYSIAFYDDGYYAVPARHGSFIVELLETGQYEVVLWAKDYPELLARIDLFGSAQSLLAQAVADLEEGLMQAAEATLRQLHSSAPCLRQVLLDAYHESPHSCDLQFYLGLVCLVCGNTEEGFFHLLSSVPYQDPWFSVCRRIGTMQFTPEIARRLLAIATALRCFGRDEEAADFTQQLRSSMHRWEVAAICSEFGSHVLWVNPQVVARTRGIIQVGANIGDELYSFSRLGIAKLLAFEPVPCAYEELLQNMQVHAREGFDWKACQMAISDEVGSLEFWQGRESGNSSFLELNPDRSAHHIGNVHDRKITVPTTTLDRFFAEEQGVDISDYNMLFMDVQGVEHKVLNGAREALKHIDFVCLEVSYTEIYLGSLTADQMEVCFNDLGFDKYAEVPGSFAEQADAIYVRRGVTGLER